MIRRTSHEVLLCASVYYATGATAFDGWSCRVDVVRVGADLRVRPQGIQRFDEDGRTRRSAPTEIGVTALDEWICRADVACVGADLRVRPQGIQRSNEDSSRLDTTDALRLDTSRASLQGDVSDG